MKSFFDKLLKREPAATPAVDQDAPATSAAGQYDTLFSEATRAQTRRDFVGALDLFDQAIAADDARAEAHYKRANVLKDLGRLDAALASYDAAIARKPEYSYAYCNRGVVQQSLGLYDAALSSYQKAVSLDPSDVLAHNNLALLLQESSRWAEALGHYDQAIASNPNFADAQFNRALNLLFQGDFAKGWVAHEWRWKSAQRLGIGAERQFRQPLWLGEESIESKRLLLHSEAGLGDTMQFARYATLCADRGATVILEAPQPLIEVFSTLKGVSELIPKGASLPSFDLHCPLMSLPLSFRTTLQTIPAPAGYLHADQDKVAHWQSVLGKRTRPRIGLAWRGNPSNPIDARRSFSLADWARHLPLEYDYFRLQTRVTDADQQVLDSTDAIFSFDDEQLDFANTAALCECLDLVISVDTSIAHLCGALGVRTWVLLPFIPDWRWMRDRNDTPWYPTMKLYRQKNAGQWEDVFVAVAADLRPELPVG
jgi:Tfp pilus assembly protein PilF